MLATAHLYELRVARGVFEALRGLSAEFDTDTVAVTWLVISVLLITVSLVKLVLLFPSVATFFISNLVFLFNYLILIASREMAFNSFIFSFTRLYYTIPDCYY